MIENILAMEQRRPPEYIIEVFADPSSVKDVVRGISPLVAQDQKHKLIAALRNFTHDILSQILPFYSTKDERYSRFNAAICGRRGARDFDRSKDSNACETIRHEL